jgi:phosphoribosylamine--glycine ligase
MADCFSKSKQVTGVSVAPGNAGIAREFECIALTTTAQIIDHCKDTNPDLVVVGPEQPLAEGLAERIRELGIACIGPSQAAARIETSKIYAKDLMRRYGIPTASYEQFTDIETARHYIIQLSKYPVVIKADGLAAGKGVVVARTQEEAIQALNRFFSPGGPHLGVVVEEFLEGWEVSLFAVCDGTDFVSTLFSQDHKQLRDGDRGPNTGGMGAYCPVPEAEPYLRRIEAEIIKPVLMAMEQEGCPYEGFLYCGLMITREGSKVVEFNCRLGDPETQALLPLLQTDMVEVCRAISRRRVKELELQWRSGSCICVVLASKGYPGDFVKGHPIRIDDQIADRLYFSGVAGSGKELATNGGRVLSVVALGNDIETAFKSAYRSAKMVGFEGKTYRSDISLRHNSL